MADDGVKSHGVTEGEVFAALSRPLLGPDDRTGNDEADTVLVIHRLEELADQIPNHLRILYHKLYGIKKREGGGWKEVGEATGHEKYFVWRQAHPPGLEVEPD